MKVTKECIYCKKSVQLEVPEEFYEAYKNRKLELIQHLPGADKIDRPTREMFISGVCPVCWNSMLKE